VVIINNNGGGIFESLPIGKSAKKLKEYFVTPHNLDLSEIVKSFGFNYQLITSRSELRQHLKKSINLKLPSVMEIKTDAKKSLELRNKYFEEVKKKLKKEISK
jgi:2-succinyl-5-enolpyruvyl-6-hydroxy-3-cyclohexene-1-carboxylate synthase